MPLELRVQGRQGSAKILLLFGIDGGQNIVGKVNYAGLARPRSAVSAGDYLRRERRRNWRLPAE